MSTDIENLTLEERQNWKRVSNMIWADGFRKGEDQGYQQGLAQYSKGWKAIFNAKVLILGFLLGMVVGTGLGMVLSHAMVTPATISAPQ